MKTRQKVLSAALACTMAMCLTPAAALAGTAEAQDATAIEAMDVSAAISIAPATTVVKTGDTVAVPVVLNNASAINGVQATIAYDATKLSITEDDVVFAEGIVNYDAVVKDGTVSLSYYGGTAAETISVATLNFKVTSTTKNDSATLTASNVIAATSGDLSDITLADATASLSLNKAIAVVKSLTTNWPYTGQKSQTVTESADATGGSCIMVASSDGTAATKYPVAGAIAAFKVGSADGFSLAAFNVTYTDENGKAVKLTNGNGLTRIGSYKASGTTYEFVVPNASDVSLNITWNYTKVAIHKTLVCGTQKVVDGAVTDGGTCTMVATQSGIAATKYPVAGNTTAFKVTNKTGYVTKAFNVTYTDQNGKKVTLTVQNKGLTRVGAYNAKANTYEFTVPGASDVSVNVTWAKA